MRPSFKGVSYSRASLIDSDLQTTTMRPTNHTDLFAAQRGNSQKLPPLPYAIFGTLLSQKI